MNASNAFKKFFSYEALVNTFELEIKQSPSIGKDHVSCEQFDRSRDSEIEIILNKVKEGTYHFTPYREMLISKGAGKKPRVVSIPTVRDKLVIKSLAKILDNAFCIECNAPTPQKLILRIVHEIESKRYDAYIKIDINSFYKSINQDILIKKLRSRIRKHEVLELIKKAISTGTAPMDSKAASDNRNGLPEGLAISNKLANIYLAQLDRTINNKFPDAVYSRYVDDILVLCRADGVQKIKKHIKLQLTKLGLNISEGKASQGSLITGSFSYLGYEFTSDRVSVRESSKRRIERSIEGIIRKIALAERLSENERQRQKKKLLLELKTRITGCKVVADGIAYRRFGWLFYYSKINDVAYLAQLDWLVSKLAKRYAVTLPGDLPTFKKAYYQMRYYGDRSNYFVTYNYSDSVEKKKRQLYKYFEKSEIDRLSDEEVNSLFIKYVRTLTSKLEQDVGTVS